MAGVLEALGEGGDDILYFCKVESRRKIKSYARRVNPNLHALKQVGYALEKRGHKDLG